MAGDVAEFLWHKFLTSLQEVESELSKASPLLSNFHHSHLKPTIRLMEREIHKKIHSHTALELSPLLYELNNAITEFRIFVQCQQIKALKNHSTFMHLNPVTEFRFVRKMKAQLASIQEDFRRILNKQQKQEVSEDLVCILLENGSQIVGLDGFIADVEAKLFDNKSHVDIGFRVLGIYGMGGSGKTTLVREVFSCERVREEFPRRVWVSLSDLTAGDKIVKLALKELDYELDKLDVEAPVMEILGILNSLLSDERYLIVLDDVWKVHGLLKDLGSRSLSRVENEVGEEEGEDMGSIRGHFSQGLPRNCGGVVIVISRLKEVARMIVGEENLLHVSPLDESNCWKIFEESVEVKDMINHPTLDAIKDEIKQQCGGLPLAAKTLAKIIPRRIVVTESNQFLENFYIPDYLLSVESAIKNAVNTPKCPVLVFIDTKVEPGENLIDMFSSVLNRNQVLNLLEEDPGNVLQRVYHNLENLKHNGDTFAVEILQRLRIVVVGRDISVNLVVGAICDLKLPMPPAIAPLTFGSSNNIGFSLGWGKKYPSVDHVSMVSILDRIMKAREMKIDNWHILLRMKAPEVGSCDPIIQPDVPGCMHALECVSSTEELNQEGYLTFCGGFWSNFSMGMDAQMLNPEQTVNQYERLRLCCAQGWFCASFLYPSSRNLANIVKVKIMKRYGEWQDLHVPHSIRWISCLNLPYFSDGTSPWGMPNGKSRRDRDLTPPYIDDGLLEIVGFRDAWHALALHAPNSHGTRLAQVNRVRFEFHKSAADYTCMSIDGERWRQSLPFDDETVVVEISQNGQVNMLATDVCRSKSVFDPSCLGSFDDNYVSDEEEEAERRKFGAANTFKIPDAVDIANLS